MSSVDVARAPANGVWRVGRAPDPLALNPPLESDELANPKTGNRFDSPLANYQTLYFATKLEACFGAPTEAQLEDRAVSTTRKSS